MNYNSIRLTKPQPALVSSEEVAQLEKQLGTKMPGGYQKFVTTFGMGILNDTVRVYTPKRISRELNNFQQRWKEHWFWDEGNNVLRKEKALEAIIIADTVNGDELIFHPSQPDKLYLLPHESGQIFECGSSLNEAIEWILHGGVLLNEEDEDEDFVRPEGLYFEPFAAES